MNHPVDDRVAHVHIGRCHIDLGSQHHFPFGNLPAVHLVEQLHRLLNRPIPVRAIRTRHRGSSFLFGYLFGRLLIHVRFSFFDQFLREIPQLLEVIGSIINVLPVESEPFDILHDGVHVLHVLLHRVGIVEPEVARTAIFLGNPKVDTNRLRVPDMQVPVGFRREARLHAAVVFPLLQVVLHHLLYKIQASFILFHCRILYFHDALHLIIII